MVLNKYNLGFVFRDLLVSLCYLDLQLIDSPGKGYLKKEKNKVILFYFCIV